MYTMLRTVRVTMNILNCPPTLTCLLQCLLSFMQGTGVFLCEEMEKPKRKKTSESDIWSKTGRINLISQPWSLWVDKSCQFRELLNRVVCMCAPHIKIWIKSMMTRHLRKGLKKPKEGYENWKNKTKEKVVIWEEKEIKTN